MGDSVSRAALLRAFFDEQSAMAGVEELRARDPVFAAAFTEHEAHVTAQLAGRGAATFFTFRLVLQRLAATHLRSIAEVDRYLGVAAVNNRLMEATLSAGDWPSVGRAGSLALAGLVAHADDAQEWREDRIQVVRQAAVSGKAAPRHIGHIVDRTLSCSGQPQTFGTLIVPREKEAIVIWPIEDEERVDLRRGVIGLPPMARDLAAYERGAIMGSFMAPCHRRERVQTGLLMAAARARYQRIKRAATR